MNRDYLNKETDLKAVDLGLSVLWANRNVGGRVPASFGEYYSWGEVYPWTCSARYRLWKLKKKIVCISGYPSFDVAAKESNRIWRIPTALEFKELINRCQWIWVDEKEHEYPSGYEIYGPNGNHIFLPTAGYGNILMPEDAYVDHQNVYGSYWSGTLCEDRDHAYILSFGNGRTSACMLKEWRNVGCSIRPVSSLQSLP